MNRMILYFRKTLSFHLNHLRQKFQNFLKSHSLPMFQQNLMFHLNH
jgi:hypothetical protein